MTVRVVADTASDLPSATADELGIELVPLTVRFGSEELVDRRDLTPAEFWARLASSSELPETAAPSPGDFEQAFRRAAEAGATGVVCVTISSALSATYEAARVAAGAVEGVIPVRVVDSRAVTMAEGSIAAAAARAAASGKGLDDVAGAAEDLVPRVRTFAALDTLENLRKGGRLGAAQALLGSMLSIKPVIQVAGGKVEPESKQRTRGRSLRYLADKVREAAPVENLAVMHGGAPDVDQLLDLLGDVHPRDQILVGEVGAVIGTHAGPRVIGVTFTVRG
ncbi:MAG: DegV family protein [Actinomycetota bacterium]|nr:DegV family protein [Actinomycetota bacterium]